MIRSSILCKRGEGKERWGYMVGIGWKACANKLSVGCQGKKSRRDMTVWEEGADVT